MKRINPKTGKPFQRFEIRADGFIFSGYNNTRPVKPDGYLHETWLSPAAWERQKRGRYRPPNNPSGKGGKFSINPKTKKKWKKGDLRDDGLIFNHYKKTFIKSDGYYEMNFVNFKSYHRRSVRTNIGRKRREGFKVDVDTDYLLSIFPKDFKCPALGIKMSWGYKSHSKKYTPSMDRIDPKKGYVKGNIVWISDRANTIKSNASVEEIGNVYKWFKKLSAKKK